MTNFVCVFVCLCVALEASREQCGTISLTSKCPIILGRHSSKYRYWRRTRQQSNTELAKCRGLTSIQDLVFPLSSSYSTTNTVCSVYTFIMLEP